LYLRADGKSNIFGALKPAVPPPSEDPSSSVRQCAIKTSVGG
jgi:hypothetical protein